MAAPPLARGERHPPEERGSGIRRLVPYTQFLAKISEDYVGPVLGDLQSRGAWLEKVEEHGTERWISGRVPLDKVLDYERELRLIVRNRSAEVLLM